MAADLEDRLARMADAAQPGHAATARARAAALDAVGKRCRRPGWRRLMPPRPVRSLAVAVAGTVAIAAVLALSLPRAADGPPPTAVTLAATNPAPGGTVDDGALRTAADMIDRRAQIMGIDGADAEVVDGDIVLRIPQDAPAGTLRDLTARGEMAMYDAARVIIGEPNGVPSRPSPGPGQRVVSVQDAPGGAMNHILIRDLPSLTNADVASVRVEEADGDLDASLLTATWTAQGRRAAHALTRSVAQAGAIRGGLSAILVVVDGELVSNPVVDPERYPDGINSDTFRIGSVGPTYPRSQRLALAAQVQEGPLPVVLSPAG